MRLIKSYYKIEHGLNRADILKRLELFGRVCYKSEDRITDESAAKFVRLISEKRHLSIFDHAYVSVRFVVNRGFTHELVRHRLAAYSQESTRFCNYSKVKFGGHVTFIIPPFLDVEPGIYDVNDYRVWEVGTDNGLWLDSMLQCENSYHKALERGWSPQEARGLLPIDLKTEIIMTANLTEWKHVFKLRASHAAHPQMREIMIPLLAEFSIELPEIFEKEVKS